MNLNIIIEHNIHENVGEYINIIFLDKEDEILVYVMRKETSTEKKWKKVLELQHKPLAFIDYFLTLKKYS